MLQSALDGCAVSGERSGQHRQPSTRGEVHADLAHPTWRAGGQVRVGRVDAQDDLEAAVCSVRINVTRRILIQTHLAIARQAEVVERIGRVHHVPLDLAAAAGPRWVTTVAANQHPAGAVAAGGRTLVATELTNVAAASEVAIGVAAVAVDGVAVVALLAGGRRCRCRSRWGAVGVAAVAVDEVAVVALLAGGDDAVAAAVGVQLASQPSPLDPGCRRRTARPRSRCRCRRPAACS